MKHEVICSKLNEILQAFSKPRQEEGVGLLAGKVGISMLQWIYAGYSKKMVYEKQAVANIEKVFEEIESNSNCITTFCSGTAGLGWFLEFMTRQNWLEDETNEMLNDIDKLESLQLKIFLHQNNWDFLHGGIGLGFYFLSRYYKMSKVKMDIEFLLHYLENTAEHAVNGELKWKSVLDIETGLQGYNISLSHGISSIVVWLSKLYNTGIYSELSSKLLTGAVNYILYQKIDKNKYGSYFPSYAIESEKELRGSRLAWCYGDLGIASALWQAGVAMQNETWKNKALEVLLYAAEKRRDLQKEYVVDAGLCHGTAGIGHIFYRAWWNTRMPEFKQAANFWFNETLKMAKFEDGLAGYKVWRTPEYGGWANEYGILEGISGIGLAMLSYITETEPTWDECLLLS